MEVEQIGGMHTYHITGNSLRVVRSFYMDSFKTIRSLFLIKVYEKKTTICQVYHQQINNKVRPVRGHVGLLNQRKKQTRNQKESLRAQSVFDMHIS